MPRQPSCDRQTTAALANSGIVELWTPGLTYNRSIQDKQTACEAQATTVTSLQTERCPKGW
jgi:hypothetical protein